MSGFKTGNSPNLYDQVTGAFIGVLDLNGKDQVGNLGPAIGIPIAADTTLTADHLEKVLDCSVGAVLTVPQDSVLGITFSTYRFVVSAAQFGAASPSFVAGSGATFRGIPPTFAQYGGPKGMIHMAANEWWYIG
jgi:hypothetical protein